MDLSILTDAELAQLQTDVHSEVNRRHKNFILSDEEIRLVRAGMKMAAIQSYRSRTGLGLMFSKAAIEGYHHV